MCSCFTCKQKTSLEKLAKDKQSSLIGHSDRDEEKSIVKLTPVGTTDVSKMVRNKSDNVIKRFLRLCLY
jgi:hypothetical protein